MSLEKRIEALESEVRAIRGTGKGWKIEYESSLEFQSNNFAPKMASSVEQHLEALTALVGLSFKVENGELFIKNVFIEEASIEYAKCNLELLISRGAQAILKDVEAVELATKEATQNQAAKSTVIFNVENFAIYGASTQDSVDENLARALEKAATDGAAAAIELVKKDLLCRGPLCRLISATAV